LVITGTGEFLLRRTKIGSLQMVRIRANQFSVDLDAQPVRALFSWHFFRGQVRSRCFFTDTPTPSNKDDSHERPPPPLGHVRAAAFKSDAPRPPAPPAAGSSRSANCNVQKLLDSYIGRCIAPRDGQVKRAVIALSSCGACPSFNRMSGITEWANCVFLFVNVGGSDYDNLMYFSHNSSPSVEDLVADDAGAACAVMTWFAQPRQDASAPVLLRLQQSDMSPVLVFFRVVGVPEYVFGGRLQCVLPSTPFLRHRNVINPPLLCSNQIRCPRCSRTPASILVQARRLG
jgi:hypothetical protein